MKITKGSLLKIKHTRTGTFVGIAERDFNSNTKNWYPITTTKLVQGYWTSWAAGERIPCRAEFCTFEVLRLGPATTQQQLTD